MTLGAGRTVFFWGTVLEREIVFFGGLDFSGAAFRDRVACFLAVFVFRVLLTAARRAFRAGDFVAVARLTIGLGRGDLTLKLPRLTGDFEEGGREFDRLIPFAIGLLI